jgi:curved DNA-binding protein CbpA
VSRPSFGELDGQDPYDILGLPTGASEAEVRTARKRLLRRYHPDLPAGDLRRTQMITAAADLLLDPLRRIGYYDLRDEESRRIVFAAAADPNGFRAPDPPVPPPPSRPAPPPGSRPPGGQPGPRRFSAHARQSTRPTVDRDPRPEPKLDPRFGASADPVPGGNGFVGSGSGGSGGSTASGSGGNGFFGNASGGAGGSGSGGSPNSDGRIRPTFIVPKSRPAQAQPTGRGATRSDGAGRWGPAGPVSGAGAANGAGSVNGRGSVSGRGSVNGGGAVNGAGATNTVGSFHSVGSGSGVGPLYGARPVETTATTRTVDGASTGRSSRLRRGSRSADAGSFGGRSRRAAARAGRRAAARGQHSAGTAMTASRWNALAIASVVAILTWTPLPLILGLLSLRQIRRFGQRGTRLAVTGVAVGAIFLIIYVYVLIIPGL